jgi:4-methyl-5(b-hydroxyethyl)-thiazole monophosphate biosynthesis
VVKNQPQRTGVHGGFFTALFFRPFRCVRRGFLALGAILRGLDRTGKIRYTKTMKSAWIFLADGFEEVEALTPFDYLKRAGVEARLVSISSATTVTGSHGLVAQAAAGIGSVLDAPLPDAVVLPGGGLGAKNLAASTELDGILKKAAASDKTLVCAICASPAVVLGTKGLLAGKRWTCFPGLEKSVTDGTWVEEPVVVDGRLLTSRAAGTAGLWSVAIIEALCGREKADEVAAKVLLR